ncbi:hypothetical protein K3495_g9951 [Podosphaera aphanis]|nr:hypothetical protein K3495_g9951 [Podosphaera aphanis]
MKEEGNSVSDADIGNWIARNEKAKFITVGSIDPIHHSDDLVAALSTRSAANLWKQATKLNGSPDRSLNTSVRMDFYNSYFNPDTISTNDYYSKLTGIQKLLLGTKRPISDDDILKRIMISIHKIPEAKVNWHGVEWRIEAKGLILQAALPVLRAAGMPNPNADQQATTLAN